MKLTSLNVVSIFKDCLPKDASLPEEQTVEVEGIVSRVVFAKEKLSAHKEEICSLWAELPDSFQKTKGGGMSFLNMCIDKNGSQWTGEHRTMEMLLLLGMGIGKVSYTIPRRLWLIFPGRMPYITVED